MYDFFTCIHILSNFSTAKVLNCKGILSFKKDVVSHVTGKVRDEMTIKCMRQELG